MSIYITESSTSTNETYLGTRTHQCTPGTGHNYPAENGLKATSLNCSHARFQQGYVVVGFWTKDIAYMQLSNSSISHIQKNFGSQFNGLAVSYSFT